MKKFCCLISLCMCCMATFAQKGVISYREEPISEGIKVRTLANESNESTVPVFINGKMYSRTLLSSIDDEQIKSFRIGGRDTIVNNVKYQNWIAVSTNDGYNIVPVSLSAVKAKYTNLKKKEPAVFLINGKLITENPDVCMIDDSSILEISTGKLKNPNMGFVEILTKTKENREKTTAFFIR